MIRSLFGENVHIDNRNTHTIVKNKKIENNKNTINKSIIHKCKRLLQLNKNLLPISWTAFSSLPIDAILVTKLNVNTRQISDLYVRFPFLRSFSLSHCLTRSGCVCVCLSFLLCVFNVDFNFFFSRKNTSVHMRLLNLHTNELHSIFLLRLMNLQLNTNQFVHLLFTCALLLLVF